MDQAAPNSIFSLTDCMQNNVLFRQKRKLELAGGGFNRGKDTQSDKLQAIKVKLPNQAISFQVY